MPLPFTLLSRHRLRTDELHGFRRRDNIAAVSGSVPELYEMPLFDYDAGDEHRDADVRRAPY